MSSNIPMDPDIAMQNRLESKQSEDYLRDDYSRSKRVFRQLAEEPNINRAVSVPQIHRCDRQ